jgi:S-DNA-T family DNA segregation ATPase FtsK/SpoIIIE
MAYLEDQKSTVVHDIAKSFQNAIPTMVGVEITGHTIDRYELKRLSDITLSLAPSLGAYSELIEYARNVSKLLHDPTGEYTEDLRRAGALDQVYIVNGEELPLLRKVSRSDISSTIPNENLDNNVMWHLPSIGDMLINRERKAEDDEYIRSQGRMIQETLALFGIPADFEGAYQGAVVTQYLIKPGYVERKVKGEVKQIKVKVAKIAGLANDLALALAAPSVRIEAPVPGTSCVGVEVANQQLNIVSLKELMESDVFQQSKGRLRIVLGEDVKGQAVISDMTRMPHLLIAGATGSGKSVCINSIISCLLLTVTPERLHLLMIDPQNMGLSIYNGIPHLRNSVITEIDKGVSAIFGVVREMERRYSQCSKVGARDLVRYNEYLSKRNEQILPHIVVIINELADLMMAFPDEAEKYICRLAQMGRAVGIHLIISTQRTSVDVITGLIKASFPARIAFAVTSQIDSRVILDIPGAERLLGRGDMLFFPPDANRLERLQGAFIDDEEINRIVYYWKTYSAA